MNDCGELFPFFFVLAFVFQPLCAKLERMSSPSSLYVHIPFCVRKCRYCAFFSVSGSEGSADRYLDALRIELATAPREQPMRSIYIGGGTPTALSPQQLATLLSDIRGLVSIQQDCEFTVEANPGTLDAEKTAVLQDAGVNRVSLGAQSFDADVLRLLGRMHGPEEIVQAVELLRRDDFAAVSLDLIFGVPYQTSQLWLDALKRALDLAPQHVSAYGLSFEQGTPLEKDLRAGKLRKPKDSQYVKMLLDTRRFLQDAGFIHYEISNYALPGCESVHNRNYWLNGSYLGIGASATAFVGGERRTNVADIQEYIRLVELTGSARAFSERLEQEAFARETAAFNIRYLPGIERRSFYERTGFDIEELVADAIEQYTGLSMLEYDGNVLRLTERGIPVADSISADFLNRE